MSKPWIFVCPSSRGIGHAVTRHLLRHTTLPILATSRADPSAARSSLLQNLPESAKAPSRLTVLQVDVTAEDTVADAAARAAELFPPTTHHLHLGFALPGILHPEKSPAQINYDDALATLQVNVLGPLMLMKHFGDFLPRKRTSLDLPPMTNTTDPDSAAAVRLPPHAVWTTLSARVGSTADNRLGGWYSYRASKAGVNSATRTFDLHVRQRCGDGGALAVAYHPGTVRTGLSREFWAKVRDDKLFSPEFAAERLVEVACGRLVEHRGRCWDWKAEEVLP